MVAELCKEIEELFFVNEAYDTEDGWHLDICMGATIVGVSVLILDDVPTVYISSWCDRMEQCLLFKQLYNRIDERILSKWTVVMEARQ